MAVISSFKLRQCTKINTWNENKMRSALNGSAEGCTDTGKANQAVFGSGLLLDASRWILYPRFTERQKKRESGRIKEGKGTQICRRARESDNVCDSINKNSRYMRDATRQLLDLSLCQTDNPSHIHFHACQGLQMIWCTAQRSVFTLKG